ERRASALRGSEVVRRVAHLGSSVARGRGCVKESQGEAMCARSVPEPAEALASSNALPAVLEPKVSLAARSLEELLDQARSAVLRHGVVHEPRRGFTRSLNGVMLTGVAPEQDATPSRQWRPDEIDWYLDTFVAKHPDNDPAKLAAPGTLVFPYTYAARARFW